MADWQTILIAVVSSLFSSSLITAGIIYVVKKGIDRAIDLRYEKLLEETRLQAKEESRRAGAVYDQQSKVLQDLVTHVHRLRRLARDLWKLYATPQRREKKGGELGRVYAEFDEGLQQFREFISTHRALLTDDYLSVQHDLFSLATSVKSYHQLLDRKAADADADEVIAGIQSALERLDDEYLSVLNLAQVRLGILDDKRAKR